MKLSPSRLRNAIRVLGDIQSTQRGVTTRMYKDLAAVINQRLRKGDGRELSLAWKVDARVVLMLL